jgi:hypothetical protein
MGFKPQYWRKKKKKKEEEECRLYTFLNKSYILLGLGELFICSDED